MGAHTLTDRERLILLNLIPEVGSTRLRKLIDHFESLEQLSKASPQEYQQIAGISLSFAQRLASGLKNEKLLTEEIVRAKQEEVRLVTLADLEYPEMLRTIPDPPLTLYVKGHLSSLNEASIAIVGSRRASLYGLQTAERLASDLALRGLNVISGLARGIDGAAHRGALKAGGYTLGVLGSGFSCFYPKEHEELAKAMTQQGAVISEYPMRMAPLPHNFPRRNRIISGLSLGIVIVEAASRSGALITCDCALEQGRSVFAVPGPIQAITSQGTNRLLQEGAKLITRVEDILEELHLEPKIHPVVAVASRTSSQDAPRGLSANNDERTLLSCLSSEQATDMDTLTVKTGLPSATCAATLLGLELKRIVQQLPGKRFLLVHA